MRKFCININLPICRLLRTEEQHKEILSIILQLLLHCSILTLCNFSIKLELFQPCFPYSTKRPRIKFSYYLDIVIAVKISNSLQISICCSRLWLWREGEARRREEEPRRRVRQSARLESREEEARGWLLCCELLLLRILDVRT